MVLEINFGWVDEWIVRNVLGQSRQLAAASVSQDEPSQSISRAAAPLRVTSTQQMERRELHKVRYVELKT